MKYLLEAYSAAFEYFDYCDLWIEDTSSIPNVDNLLRSFAERYSNRIYYNHLEDYPDQTTDLKVANCFEIVKDRYDYVFLCGDGIQVDIGKLYDILHEFENKNKNYDLIHFNSYIQTDSVEYTSGIDFVKDCGWLSTYYGATVVSSSLIKRIDYKKYIGSFRNTGFMFWEGLISGIASEREHIVVLREAPTISNPYKGVNSSYQPKKFINFWVVNWNRVIDELPSYYNSIKSYIKKDVGNKLGLYRVHNLLILRNSQNLEYSDIADKKNLFQAVTDTPFFFIILASKIPLGISNGLEKMVVMLKRLVRR